MDHHANKIIVGELWDLTYLKKWRDVKVINMFRSVVNKDNEDTTTSHLDRTSMCGRLIVT